MAWPPGPQPPHYSPPAPAPARPPTDTLALALGILVILLALGAGMLLLVGWAFFAANSMRSPDGPAAVTSFAIPFAIPLLLALGAGVTAIVTAIRPSPARPNVGRLVGAIGLVLVIATWCVPWLLLRGAARSAGNEADRYQPRVSDVSAIGRPCQHYPGMPPIGQGNCPAGYQCTTGAYNEPQTPAPTCRIPCYGRDTYCLGGTRCIQNNCQFRRGCD